MPVFALGQLYTNLSRVRRCVDIRILREPSQRNQPTLDIVHRHLLLPVDVIYVTTQQEPSNTA